MLRVEGRGRYRGLMVTSLYPAPGEYIFLKLQNKYFLGKNIEIKKNFFLYFDISPQKTIKSMIQRKKRKKINPEKNVFLKKFNFGKGEGGKNIIFWKIYSPV